MPVPVPAPAWEFSTRRITPFDRKTQTPDIFFAVMGISNECVRLLEWIVIWRDLRERFIFIGERGWELWAPLLAS